MLPPHLIAELEHFERVCNEKRRLLGNIAVKRVRWRQFVSFLSGLLALGSAASIFSIFVELTSAKEGQTLSAIFSIVAGMLTLLGSTYFDEKETNSHYAGMSVLVSLRERAHLQRMRTSNPEEKVYETLDNLWMEYCDISLYCDPLLEGWFAQPDRGPAPPTSREMRAETPRPDGGGGGHGQPRQADDHERRG